MLVVLASSARDNVLDQGFSTQPLVDTPSLLHAPQDLMSFKWACTNGHDDYVAEGNRPKDRWWRRATDLRTSGGGGQPTRELVVEEGNRPEDRW